MKRYKVNSTLIEVDWDSFEDVSQLFNAVKARYHDLNPNKISRKMREKNVFDACMNVWETDISDIYLGRKLDDSPIYYVYCHMNPLHELQMFRGKHIFCASLGMKFSPFYIGKGTGDRAFKLNRSETHRKIKHKIMDSNKDPEVCIIKEGLTELEALSYESKLIDIFGLVPNKGWLTNLDEGHMPDVRRNKYYSEYKILCPGSITDWADE